ncbi:hypothetical protein [Sphingomonas lycopersici]|uniref:Uncharacterized protein n=1 Tax=Sphingomonas lycopersici TaxID=2951807 RepID=A0AA41Z9P6_9SPHN|nr:hypothetical protein [Sphingomonas lycopersici]MCW6536512.1 hypothetical protein [Sphingomonas lycopersici]
MPAQLAATGIIQLDTPALLLDRATMDRNIARMRDKVASLGVALPPHIKVDAIALRPAPAHPSHG